MIKGPQLISDQPRCYVDLNIEKKTRKKNMNEVVVFASQEDEPDDPVERERAGVPQGRGDVLHRLHQAVCQDGNFSTCILGSFSTCIWGNFSTGISGSF